MMRKEAKEKWKKERQRMVWGREVVKQPGR